VFLIYGSKITAASRGFPATARLSCIIKQLLLLVDVMVGMYDSVERYPV